MKFGKYFCGNEISAYGRQNGYVDYATLAKSFQHVLCNDDEGNVIEFFQSFVISETGAEILQSYTDETVLYNEEYNMYVWRIAHYGTSWDYVLTDIKCEKEVQ